MRLSCALLSGAARNVLHVTAAHKTDSLCKVAATAVLRAIEFPHEITERNLWETPLPQFTPTTAKDMGKILKGMSSESLKDVTTAREVMDVARELSSADVLVLSSPVWNMWLPYVVKQYLDVALQTSSAFRSVSEATNGFSPPSGDSLAQERIAIFVISWGGKASSSTGPSFSPGDYLCHVIRGAGFSESLHVSFEGSMQLSRQQLEVMAMQRAVAAAEHMNQFFSRS